MAGLEEWLEQYMEATVQALEAVRQGQTDWLHQCLDRRDRLIKEMDGMGRVAGDVVNSEPVRERVRRIGEMDRELIAALTGVRDGIREKIASLQQGKRLRNQYTPSFTFADGVFFDRRR